MLPLTVSNVSSNLPCAICEDSKRLYLTWFSVLSVSVDSDDIPGIGQYDDFHTIDWQRDIARDRMRHRYIVKKKHDSIWGLIQGAHDAWSGWLCVLLVGFFTGGRSRYHRHLGLPG